MNSIVSEVVRRLSGCKYFYDDTIDGCIETVCHERQVEVDKSAVKEQVKQAFVVLTAERIWK